MSVNLTVAKIRYLLEAMAFMPVSVRHESLQSTDESNVFDNLFEPLPVTAQELT